MGTDPAIFRTLGDRPAVRTEQYDSRWLNGTTCVRRGEVMGLKQRPRNLNSKSFYLSIRARVYKNPEDSRQRGEERRQALLFLSGKELRCFGGQRSERSRSSGQSLSGEKVLMVSLIRRSSQSDLTSKF